MDSSDTKFSSNNFMIASVWHFGGGLEISALTSEEAGQCVASENSCDFNQTHEIESQTPISFLISDFICRIWPVTQCSTHSTRYFFFIRINIFQPSLKLILNFSRFQPRNILRWFLKVEMTKWSVVRTNASMEENTNGDLLEGRRCRRLLTGPKCGKISYFECNWSFHNWLGAGSEPWVILRLFLIT